MVLRSIIGAALFALAAFYSFFWAHELRLTWFDAREALQAASRYEATIVRDRFGVPHVSGERDADAAYGLAIAHAEDDFQTVQRAILAARGRLATVDGFSAFENDYFVQLLGIWDTIATHYASDLSAGMRAVLDGYAAGLNYYAALHRSALLPGFAPVRGEDLAALFMLRLPSAYGLQSELRAVITGDSALARDWTLTRGVAMAIAPSKSADSAARLLINPQGPFTGLQSWYEAHIQSGEGWNLAGGLMPGAPILLSGAGPSAGWAIVPNHPHLVDIERLEVNPGDANSYRRDGAWQKLVVREVPITVRIWGPIRWIFRAQVLSSAQGPVLRRRDGTFAIRYAGQKDVRGIEAFYRLNKAQDFDTFRKALSDGAIPSFSFVYADKTGRIAQIYNDRPVAPSDNEDATREARASAAPVPKIVSPMSGFVVAANASPFRATADPFNVKTDGFPASLGIETHLTNRAERAVALLSAARSVSLDDLKAIKFDHCYARGSDFAAIIREIANRNYAGDPLLEEAGEILRRYDLCTDKSNRGAALAIIAAFPLAKAAMLGLPRPDLVETLRNAARLLLAKFRRLDPTWGEVNRLRRDDLDLPLGGGPDVLRDIELQPRMNGDGTTAAPAGDSLVMIASWTRNGGWTVESVVPYGSSANPDSPHYADQARLYASEQLKPLPLATVDILSEATSIEHPGRSLKARARAPSRRSDPPAAAADIQVSAPAGEADRAGGE